MKCAVCGKDFGTKDFKTTAFIKEVMEKKSAQVIIYKNKLEGRMSDVYLCYKDCLDKWDVKGNKKK